MTFRARLRFSTLCGVLCSGAAVFAPRAAHADVSSWVYAGVGPGFLDRDEDPTRLLLDLEIGVGSSPSAVVVGGLFRTQTYFSDGTDLALLARVASRGFVQGGWGLALDAGGYQRFWGIDSTGGTASLVLGAPWGISLHVNGGIGSNDQRFAGLTFGIDFARLTVYRTAGTQWFMNPFATDEKGRGPR